jgi:hypothetical protein
MFVPHTFRELLPNHMALHLSRLCVVVLQELQIQHKYNSITLTNFTEFYTHEHLYVLCVLMGLP